MQAIKTLIKRNWLAIMGHVVFWSALLLLPQLLNMPEWREQGRRYGLPYTFFLIAGLLNILLFYCNVFFLYPRLFHRRTWWLYFLCLLLLVMITNAAKVGLLKGWFGEVAIDSYTGRYIFFPSVLLAAAGFIYRLIRDKMRHDRLLQEQRAMQLATELKLLRSQVSPHFLFNVLNGMVALSRQGASQLEPALIRLSGLMRYMLYQPEVQRVPLRQEVAYVQDYIALQRMRFDTEVEITEDWPDIGEQLIAPMLLIPFVENAFKHGIGMVTGPYIHIHMYTAAAALHFVVENNFLEVPGQSKDQVSGIGLTNVRSRLELLYPGRYRLHIRQEGNIFIVHLQLPLE
ncbi:histidine kinase [Chitinophaga pendula]|uniref:sensor histidine kinase n=1 Tax=Chitinophaga TaxID=79328 RepID=UPI0012FD81FB|nr:MULTISPECIES: histidine kinase [Chitinophaga]UCJ08581.1 histidine kinase [Chitinophaga pendula]